MRKITFATCLLTITAIGYSTPVIAESVIVEVGSTQIAVPIPEGFRDLRAASPEFFEFAAASFAGPGNRLLTVFVTDDDYHRIVNGLEADMARTISLQVREALEDESISPYQYTVIADDVKREQATLVAKVRSIIDEHMADASEAIENEVNVPVAIRLMDQVPLGVFFEWNEAFGMIYLLKMQSKIDEVELNVVMVNANSFMLVRNRIIYGYVASDYQSESDSDWAKQLAESLTRQILDANR